MAARKKTTPNTASPEQTIFERHTPEIVGRLEHDLRAYFAAQHPNFAATEREDAGPEHEMWLYERWDPVEMQKIFLKHVGRISAAGKAGSTAHSRSKQNQQQPNV